MKDENWSRVGARRETWRAARTLKEGSRAFCIVSIDNWAEDRLLRLLHGAMQNSGFPVLRLSTVQNPDAVSTTGWYRHFQPLSHRAWHKTPRNKRFKISIFGVTEICEILVIWRVRHVRGHCGGLIVSRFCWLSPIILVRQLATTRWPSTT